MIERLLLDQHGQGKVIGTTGAARRLAGVQQVFIRTTTQQRGNLGIAHDLVESVAAREQAFSRPRASHGPYQVRRVALTFAHIDPTRMDTPQIIRQLASETAHWPQKPR